MAAPVYVQDAFRGRYDNGSLTTATYKAELNTNFNADIDQVFRLRQVVQNTAANADTGDQTYELWCDRNEAGSYFQVTSTSSYIQLANDANSIADNAATVQSIGTGTYTADTSNGYNDGTTDDITGTVSIGRSREAEIEHCLKILSTSSANDTFDFRLRRSTATLLDTYNYTPRVTAVAAHVPVTHEGQTSLTHVYTLDTDVTKTLAGFLSLSHVYTLNTEGKKELSGQLSLSNIYESNYQGVLNLAGGILFDNIYLLNSDGNTVGTLFGQLSLSHEYMLTGAAIKDLFGNLELNHAFISLYDGQIISFSVPSHRMFVVGGVGMVG